MAGHETTGQPARLGLRTCCPRRPRRRRARWRRRIARRPRRGLGRPAAAALPARGGGGDAAALPAVPLLARQAQAAGEHRRARGGRRATSSWWCPGCCTATAAGGTRPTNSAPNASCAGAPERPRHAYVPFSLGPRVCTGMGFGLAEAVIVLATLLPALPAAAGAGGAGLPGLPPDAAAGRDAADAAGAALRLAALPRPRSCGTVHAQAIGAGRRCIARPGQDSLPGGVARRSRPTRIGVPSMRLLVKANPAATQARLGVGTGPAQMLSPLMPSIDAARAEPLAWHVSAPVDPRANPWDLCHALLRQGLGFAGGEVALAEPDLEQHWLPPAAQRLGLGLRSTDCSVLMPQSDNYPKGPADGWFADAGHSGLAEARAALGRGAPAVRHRASRHRLRPEPPHQAGPAAAGPGAELRRPAARWQPGAGRRGPEDRRGEPDVRPWHRDARAAGRRDHMAAPAASR